MPERPFPKPPEELREQANRVSEELDESIAPPSSFEELLSLSEQEIKKRYPKRYEFYVQMLRNEKSGKSLRPRERKAIERELHVLNSLDEYIELHRSPETDAEKTLHDPQVAVFEDLRNFLEQGETEGYIKLPTGTGKTVLFIEFIEATRLKTLIVVPTKTLIRQTGDKLDEFAEDIDYGKIYGDAKQHGRQVTIITYNSLISGVNNGSIRPEDYECMILDEAHRSLGEKTSETVRKFTDTLKVGFTATPDFSSTKRLSRLLSKEIHRMTIAEAVEADLLCPFNVVIPETDVDITGVKIDPNTGRYVEKDLEKKINVQRRNLAALDLYKRAFAGEKMVGNCLNVQHTETLTKLFRENGIPAESISGKIGDKQQGDILKRFETGETLVVFQARILIEGFDEPSVGVAFNLAPSLSPVDTEQRGGRVLRKDLNNPDKFATIVDFLDKVDKDQLKFTEGGKRKVPISFAEVAGGALILPDVHEQTGTGKKRPTKLRGDISDESPIEGIKVISKPEEVMRVVKDLTSVPEKAKRVPKDWITGDTVTHFLLSNGILVDFPSVSKTLAELAQQYPDLTMAYTPPQGGKPRIFYSPELVEMVKEKLS